MKKLTMVFLVTIITATFGAISFADSPLSSTDFYRAYNDKEMVHYAIKVGVVDEVIAKYLSISEYDINVEFRPTTEEKLAVINAIYLSASNFNRTGNADRFLKIVYNLTLEDIGKDLGYFYYMNRFKSKEDSKKTLIREDECLAYLMAMDDLQGAHGYKTGPNYAEDEKLHPLEVISLNYESSFSKNIIRALIMAQYKADSRHHENEESKIWSPIEDVIYNNYTDGGYSNYTKHEDELIEDMRPEAASIIYEYMQIYDTYSAESKVNPFLPGAKWDVKEGMWDGSQAIVGTIYYPYYEEYYRYYEKTENIMMTKGKYIAENDTDEQEPIVEEEAEEIYEETYEETYEEPKKETWYDRRLREIEEEKANAKFKDVNNNHWAKEDINKMSEVGVIKGKSDGKFDPNGTITRAEAATLMNRLMEHIIKTLTEMLTQLLSR